MPKNKSIMPELFKAIISVASPGPVREARGAAAYAKNPSKAVSSIALFGRLLPREAKAVLDVYAMTRKR